MSACVILFGIFLPKGVEGGCIAIVAGGCVAECLSGLWAGIMCSIDRYRHLKNVARLSDVFPNMDSIRSLSSISIPIAASTYIRSALLTLEHMLIPKTLKMNGMSHSAALASYGMLGSMVLPVVLYPASLTSSFASLLIPEFSEAKARGDIKHIKRAAMKAIFVTFAFAACVSGVMLSYSGPLGRVIYNSTEAGKYIRLLAPIIPIMYLDTVVDSMLKGLGYQVYTMTVNIVDAALSIVGVLILIPKLGILGYVILISVSELVNASASFWKLSKVLGLDFSIRRLILLPTASAIITCAFVREVYAHLLYVSAESVFGLVIHISSVICVYSILCYVIHFAPKLKKPYSRKKPLAV
jgi:stage V sporulation protein B